MPRSCLLNYTWLFFNLYFEICIATASVSCTGSLLTQVYCVQVLRLVYCLVKYGYYGSASSLQQLIEPLMNLLDGKRDLPYPTDHGNLLALCSGKCMESVAGMAFAKC